MHVPPHYRPRSQAEVFDVVRRHPFGVLVGTHADGQPWATHIPMTLVEPADGSLPTVLRGHLDRANPHAEILGTPQLAIFNGPNAYVSPDHYARPSAPTWNYVAAHLRGPTTRVTMESDETLLRAIIADLLAFSDPTYPPKFAQLPRAYVDPLLHGIVGFELRIEKAEAIFKLSQDKPAGDRERVADALCSGEGVVRDTGEAMRGLKA